VLGFRGNEKEITSLCARRTHRQRTLREDWPVVGGKWRHTGAEEIPCVQVRERGFLGSWVPAEQLRSWRKGVGVETETEWDRVGEQESKVSAGSTPDLSHGTKC
jgi:hypothetical protein